MSDESIGFLPTDPLLERPVAMDAPLAVKARWARSALNTRVTGPGQAETGAAPAGNRTAVRGQHNWVPIGPRNVGGRLRDVAVDQQQPEIMYAAAASGGVFKSVDGGDSWFPLWHDEPSLSMSAIGICAGNGRFVYAATGESQAGGGETIPAGGVWFSQDRGETWRPPNPGQPILAARIHAIAVHPTNGQICWAAAQDDGAAGGLYRTMDGGQTWHRFAAGRGFADVKFATFPGNVLRLFVVPEGPVTVGPAATPSDQAFVVRIDNPDALDPVLDPVLPAFAGPYDTAANPDPLRAVGVAFRAGPTTPGLGKLAIYEGTAAQAPVVFVAYTHRDIEPSGGPPVFVDRSYFGIFRIRDAHTAAANAMTFREINPGPTFGSQGQGGYNIAFAVDPTNPNNLAFGMVELFVHRSANANNPPGTAWLRAQMWDLYHLERGHHADHHALVFAAVPAAPFHRGLAAGTMTLWNANDGGLSWCPDVTTGAGYPMSDPGNAAADASATLPVPAGAFTWIKRGHGIVAPQMYDLTQHPRLGAVLGCGFQDNGVFVGAGSSWQLALTADGGFVAFDPDDPYRFIATIQTGVREVRFPGRLRDAAPVLAETLQTALFPRQLDAGFRPEDGAPFVAETVFHPRRPGRVVTARQNRLYGTRATTGERWVPEPLGTTVELIVTPRNPLSPSLVVEVLDTAGGRALGWLPQRKSAARAGNAPVRIRLTALGRAPFRIGAGQDVRLRFEPVPPTGAAPPPINVVIPLTVGPTLPAAPTAGELADYLTTQLRARLAAAVAAGPAVVAANVPDVEALPLVPRTALQVVVASNDTGHAGQVVLGGTAMAKLFSTARAFSGADAGAGGPALPAWAPIPVFSGNSGMDLTGSRLRITREGGADVVDIDCDVEFGADVTRVTGSGLFEALRRRLPAARYHVYATTELLGVRLSSTAATNVVLQGDLAPDLATTAAAPPTTVRLMAGGGVMGPTQDHLNLTAPAAPPVPPPGLPRTLRLREATHSTAMQNLDAAFLRMPAADLSTVTMVELIDALRRMLTAAPTVRMRCDLEVGPDGAGAVDIREVTFGPPGSRVVWAGDETGRIYRSGDDGDHWREVPWAYAERDVAVEAIAVHPEHPERVVAGCYLEGGGTEPRLLRSTDDGAHWTPATAPPADAAGNLGVRALVYQPTAPFRLFAATDAGIFVSADDGDRWAAFNEGLPNVRVSDLALCETTGMLRAGAWGRGVYERHIGAEPARDTHLYVRSTVLDDGHQQPQPGPDPGAPVPRSTRFDESPDIKLLRTDPRVGVVVDGVEFDDELRSLDVTPGPGFVAVQVHNRGAFAATGVRVTALWARADDGPPAVPAELWPALAAPPAPGTTIGAWTVIEDAAVTGPVAGVHDVVTSVQPRVLVLGAAAPALSWPADLGARVGVLVVARGTENPLPAAPTSPVPVLDLVRSMATVAYREADVVTPGVDGSVVLRSQDGVAFAVLAGTPAAQNGANGAAPLGLAATGAAGTIEARFAQPAPFALGAARTFIVSQRRVVTATFAAGDPRLPNLAAATIGEVAAVIDDAIRAAGAPLRVSADVFFNADLRPALRMTAATDVTFTVAGTAATTFGVTAATAVSTVTSTFANRGPWNLTAGAPRTMTITVTARVPIQLGPGVRELTAPAAATGVQVGAAINRQLRERGVTSIVAEPIRRSLSVRRSGTETAGGRQVLGGLGFADLIAEGAAVGAAGRAARFDLVTAHSQDRLTGGGNQHLYLRVANTGNVDEAAVRLRLFLVDAGVTPITLAALAPVGGPVAPAVATGASVIAEFVVPLPPMASNSHQWLLAVADVDEDGQRVTVPPPAADLASLDALDRFCHRTPGAALREFLAT